MAKQQTLAGLAWKNKGKKTRREQFLSEMNQIIPWRELMQLIEPYYPKAGRGRQPLGLEKRGAQVSWGHIWKLNLTDPQVLSPPIFVDDVGLTLKAIAEWMGVTDMGSGEEAANRKGALHQRRRLPSHRRSDPSCIKLSFQM